MRALLLTLMLLAPAPAYAGELVNDEQVAACLADNAGEPETCGGVLEAPCAHHRNNGLLRACLFRLRERWERQVATSDAAMPSANEMAATCPREGAEPVGVSIRRNRCRIMVLATRWADAQ